MYTYIYTEQNQDTFINLLSTIMKTFVCSILTNPDTKY